ncbi:hypothetical protein H1P_80046 [Hyella patelloides LEGE 07179]|uniref:Uncharacterized protein n=1 Tax=Hyella patelloides LEGE 07179 TaxID=945734 RepID=A0A563W472_9CYAN|nr:hypothetical protein H1P_80046 [Hyella patelloides LEGE 07179]
MLMADVNSPSVQVPKISRGEHFSVSALDIWGINFYLYGYCNSDSNC